MSILWDPNLDITVEGTLKDFIGVSTDRNLMVQYT